jgi:hypothetical protein
MSANTGVSEKIYLISMLEAAKKSSYEPFLLYDNIKERIGLLLAQFSEKSCILQ